VTPTSAWRATSERTGELGKPAARRLWQNNIKRMEIALNPSNEGILFNPYKTV